MDSSLRCSVVVPVWNPGPNLDRCVESLLGQTMPHNRYEIVLVDDGSTDGSAERLDTLELLHPHRVRVLHTPPSGWPGRPRNIGTDAARGTYVYFVDNDDVLPAYALQAMCDAADRSNADVVMGRPASNFRGINHGMYQRDRIGVTLADFPDLVESTTPHKMFRREFLARHGIRFPEGMPHEDQPFMMRAFIHASSITLLTDRCYYFYLRRLGSGRNAGDQSIDPAGHFEAVEEVLDVLDAEVPDSALRDHLARRFYRVEVLNVLWAIGTINADSETQQQLFDTLRRIATTRFGPGVRAGADAVHRTLGALVEMDDVSSTLEFAKHCRSMGLRAEVSDMRWVASALHLTIEATLTLAGEPLQCELGPHGWALPAALAPTVSPADRLLDTDRDGLDAQVMLVSRITSETFGLDSPLRIETDESGSVKVVGTVSIDPESALAGARLSEGPWDVRLRLWFAGIGRAPALRVQLPDVPPPLLAAHAGTVRPFVHGKGRFLALDVGGWLRSPASTLASSSDLTVLKSNRLQLSVSGQVRATTAIRLQFTPADQSQERSFGCVGSLTASSDGFATAVLRVPPNLPDGDWQPWLHLESTGARAPVKLPWLVHRSKRVLHVEPGALQARAQPAERGAQRSGH